MCCVHVCTCVARYKYDQLLNKLNGCTLERLTVLGSGPHIPTIFFWDNSPEVCFLTLVLLYIFSYENEFDFHDSEHVRL